jgi:hypothetical protein
MFIQQQIHCNQKTIQPLAQNIRSLDQLVMELFYHLGSRGTSRRSAANYLGARQNTNQPQKKNDENLHISGTRGNTHYHPVGHFNPSPSYCQIHFKIDIHLITKQMTNVRNTIAYICKMFHISPMIQSDTRQVIFLLRTHLDIDTKTSEFKDPQAIVGDINPNN